MNRTLTTLLTSAAGAFALAIPAHAGDLHWSGSVDDTATIYVSQRDVRVDANGRGVHNVRQDLRGQLPRRPVNVRLREESGRGNVRIVQQPSARNGFTAAVRIHDPAPGAHRYDFTLQWNDAGRGRYGGYGAYGRRWRNGPR